jgi:hypothetical protein
MVLQKEDLEFLWPLLIPPLMTLLDDYDPPFKIRGIVIVREMLRNVDANLLKRTGIATLLSAVSIFASEAKDFISFREFTVSQQCTHIHDCS